MRALAFGQRERPYPGINAAERCIFIVPSHPPHDQVSPVRVMWGAPAEQRFFVAYANEQCLLQSGERWKIKLVDGSSPTDNFVITQVIPPGGVCPFTDGPYSPSHHGIVFSRCDGPPQHARVRRLGVRKTHKTIAKKNSKTSVHFRGPMDKFVQRV